MSFTKKQLLPGEELIILARQHPLTLFWPIAINVIVLALLIWISLWSQRAWFLALTITVRAVRNPVADPTPVGEWLEVAFDQRRFRASGPPRACFAGATVTWRAGAQLTAQER